MSFTCPRCGMTSSHPTDEAEGYCGNCHDWTLGHVRKATHEEREALAAAFIDILKRRHPGTDWVRVDP